MEQDRFDELAKQVFSGSSRRRVIGGALASVVGLGVAAVTGVDAKKGKAKAKKGKAKGEFVCTAANANIVACATVACTTDVQCNNVGCFGAPACVAGFCTGDPGNTDGACPLGSCCQSTPAGVSEPGCIPFAQQSAAGVIGDAGGGSGVCITCPAGTLGDPVTGRCVCSALSCPDGCCIDNTGFSSTDQCIANGSGAPVNSVNPGVDGNYVCGTGGVSCLADSSICSVGTLFSGCCSAQGFCVAGTSNNACGSGGELCEVCQNDSSCGIDQACTGGTTTTTTTTTAAPACTGNKVQCGTGAGAVCCGPKRKCKDEGNGTFRCGKKK